MRAKRKKKQLENLRKNFVEESPPEIKEASEEDKELLDQVVEKINKGKEIVRLSLPEKVSLRIESPDVIVLQTPTSILHKSFSQIRFQKLEKEEGEVKLYISDN